MTIEYDKPNNGVTVYKTPKIKYVNGKRMKFYGSIDYLIKPKTLNKQVIVTDGESK